MKQIKFLLFVLLIQTATWASDGIRFENLKWAEVKAKALKEKKMIFLDAFASWCGPCKYMEENIYTDPQAADYFNKQFINVKIDMEAGEGPALSEEFNVGAYPTFLFFTPDGKLVHKSVGSMDTDEFIALGKNATDPGQQYFTLKNKAKAGQLNDAAFFLWVKQADKMDDEDLGAMVKKYLEGKKDVFANADLAGIFFYHSLKTEKMVRTCLDNKARLMSLMKWDAATAENELYNLLFSYSLKSYTNYNSSIDSFLSTFRRLNREKAGLAEADIRYRIEMYVNKDATKGMELLISYLADTKATVPLEMVSNWMIDHEDEFGETEYQNLYKAIETYNFRPADKGQECWIYLMQMLAAVKNGEKEKAKAYALKAYQHEHLPEVYKTALKANYDLK